MRLTQRSELPALTRAVRAAPLLAIDTEFHAERRYLPRIHLLQVHVPGGPVYLLDPSDPEVIPPIADALVSRPWLLHAGRQDLRILKPLLGSVPDLVWDSQIAAGLLGPHYPTSYADLVQEHIGARLEKGATMSDWSRRPLSERQLKYAADDVRLLPELWSALRDALVTRDRLEIARAACAGARDKALGPPDFPALWQQLPASRALDGVALAVLQELCIWREQRAIEANQPARSVLGDGMLVDLARRRPRSIGHMMANRRFPKRVAQKLGDELLGRIRICESRPSASWPRVVRDHTPKAGVLDLLRLTVATAGAEQGWSQPLVAPRPVLAQAVLDPSPAQAARQALAPWQWELAGPAIEGALEGRWTLGLHDGAPAINP